MEPRLSALGAAIFAGTTIVVLARAAFAPASASAEARDRDRAPVSLASYRERRDPDRTHESRATRRRVDRPQSERPRERAWQPR